MKLHYHWFRFISLYFGQNCSRRNNGHSNEGWPDCETSISIRSPQKVKGNKVFANLVADGLQEEIEQDWFKDWNSELLEQVYVAGRIYCGAPGSFHGVICNCVLSPEVSSLATRGDSATKKHSPLFPDHALMFLACLLLMRHSYYLIWESGTGYCDGEWFHLISPTDVYGFTIERRLRVRDYRICMKQHLLTKTLVLSSELIKNIGQRGGVAKLTSQALGLRDEPNVLYSTSPQTQHHSCLKPFRCIFFGP